MRRWVWSILVVVACGPGPRGADDVVGGDDTIDATPVGTTDAPPACVSPLPPAGPEVELAPPFDTMYTVYDLGTPPGIPNPLGGTAILSTDPNTLLIAGGSETSLGAIYQVAISRDSCGHITGLAGVPTVHANTPFVDANLVYAGDDLMLYTEWPQYTLSQLRAGSTAPDQRTDLRPLGMPDVGDQGPGGHGFVPPGLPGAGGLRLVTWPGGRWYHVDVTPGPLLGVTAITQTVTVPNEPGGFAYVPAGSPGFANQSLILAEWRLFDPTLDRVAVYEVDGAGDPVLGTRREFFHRFPRPWGAYFEPVTGDYLFLSWGTGNDRIYIVQGFVPPPPID